MNPQLKKYCDTLSAEFHLISEDRKNLLGQLRTYIDEKRNQKKSVRLIFICTHNSRRSHFGQVWAKTASHYYGKSDIQTYSGGTEATAFNSNAIAALERAGFEIHSDGKGNNPNYSVYYDPRESPIVCFSKVFDDSINPKENFAAIMTCSDADENCPFISGCDIRIPLTYEDPKIFDGSEREVQAYDERCRQIAREMFYLFSQSRN